VILGDVCPYWCQLVAKGINFQKKKGSIQMNILVTNDDGIYAKGINALVLKLAEKGHKVFVVAPDRERSASGQAITLHSPLQIKKVNKWDGVEAYAVDGTLLKVDL